MIFLNKNTYIGNLIVWITLERKKQKDIYILIYVRCFAKKLRKYSISHLLTSTQLAEESNALTT